MGYAHRRAGRGGHPLLTGMSIGLLLGLALALAVAVYLYRANPFTQGGKEPLTRPAAKAEKPQPPPAGMPTGEAPPAPPPLPGRTAPTAPAGPVGTDVFDMLPHPGTARPGREAPTAQSRVLYFLQAGSFQRAEDADNLKAQLALSGLEATIVTASVGDRGIWHRVRLGPFADQGTLQSARSLLRDSHIESTVITVTEEQLRNSAQGAQRP